MKMLVNDSSHDLGAHTWYARVRVIQNYMENYIIKLIQGLTLKGVIAFHATVSHCPSVLSKLFLPSISIKHSSNC